MMTFQKLPIPQYQVGQIAIIRGGQRIGTIDGLAKPNTITAVHWLLTLFDEPFGYYPTLKAAKAKAAELAEESILF